MGLTVRERMVLTDIEQTLAQDDPRLARQLAHMTLRPPPGPDPAHPYAPRPPGPATRRFAKWCGALALVLLVLSDLLVSVEVLYAALAAALLAVGSRLAARTTARITARTTARRRRAAARP